MILKKKQRLLVLLGLLYTFSISSAVLARQPEVESLHPDWVAVNAEQKDITAKIRQFLEQSGYNYTKVSDTVWSIPYQGKSLANFEVNIITIPDSDLFLIVALVAQKQNLKVSQDLFYKLLKFNHSVDWVKVAITDDGDLIVRIDIDGRTMDLKAFKDAIAQLAAATDELHGQIKASLIPE
jgi:hypothetical protein